MVRFGCRMSRKAGLRIAMETGFRSLTMVGRGLAPSPGAGRLITTGAGCGTAIRGPGGPDRYGAEASIVRSGRRRMCRFSDSEVVGVWALVLAGADGAASAGFRSGLVTASSHGGADMAGASAWWDS